MFLCTKPSWGKTLDAESLVRSFDSHDAMTTLTLQALTRSGKDQTQVCQSDAMGLFDSG
jgi:hypothetical protein